MSELHYPTVAGLDRARVAAFVARRHGTDPDAVKLDVRPLHGGLEASGVWRVAARYRERNARRTDTFVVKQLDPLSRREADFYCEFLEPAGSFAPRLLGVDEVGHSAPYLYLEYVREVRIWPWDELAPIKNVLDTLARLHTAIPNAATLAALAGWDYETELQRSAVWTTAMFDQAIVAAADLGDVRPYGVALHRLALDLPRLRAELFNAAPAGPAILHGDVQSRNVLLRARAGVEEPVLIDWGRARLGSPLEDVSSWLQSLATWESDVRRRHDGLLRRYLGARGLPTTLSRSFRDEYWLAAACNSLSGALGYSLAVALDKTGRSPSERRAAIVAMRQHLRVVRRADALWRT